MSCIRPVILVLGLAALAIGLAACGGASSASGTGEGDSSNGVSSGASQGSSGSRQGSSSGYAQKKGSGADSDSSQRASGGSSSAAAQQDSGGGAAQFQTKGGDNSVQQFGGEGGESEREQAAAALHAYLDARAGEEWKRACENLAAGVANSLQQLSGAAQGGAEGQSRAAKKMGCPQLLAAMSTGMPGSLKRDLTKADVGSLRVEGDHAFLLYHGAHNSDYFMPMARESGRWKVAALAVSALP